LLIFSGPLAPYASWGVTLALVTAVVIGLFTLLAGTHAGQVCIPQDRIASILGFMSASIIARAGADAAPEALFATLAAAIACSTLLAGLGGGMVGFPSLSLSRLVKEAGATGRLVHGAMVVVCLACLAGNLEWIGTLPRFVLGGLLLSLGLVFLHEWLIASWDRLPRADYAAVVVILGVIAFSGYFQGLAVGLLIATLVFVANYSRVRVVTHRLSGAEQRSNVDRSPEEQNILAREGHRIQVLRLQGVIFFGSASSLLTSIREQLESGTGVDMVVVDFQPGLWPGFLRRHLPAQTARTGRRPPRHHQPHPPDRAGVAPSPVTPTRWSPGAWRKCHSRRG
jgi:MFS superfamily sulfate permease-like transporter